MSAPLNRRGFLGHAVTVLGGLALPSGLLLASPPPPTDADVQRDTLEAVRRILATPRASEAARSCDCVHCRRAQAQPFLCVACGFAGRPLTMECQCEDELASHISFNEAALRTHTRATWPRDWKTSRSDVLRQQRTLKALGTVGCCEGMGRGMPDVGSTERGMYDFEGTCYHTQTVCPVCGDWGDGTTIDQQGFLATLRELNALLAGSVT